MRLALGADHAGYTLKDALRDRLRGQGHDVLDLGTDGPRSVDYPNFAVAVAQAVRDGRAERGIIVCGTGQGVAMAANKVPGIRAGVAADPFSARMIVEHNDGQVLCLGARVVGGGLADDIVDAFLSATFAGGRHAARVDLLRALDEEEQGG
jgi:ribose 5-phosphate isomerase B